MKADSGIDSCRWLRCRLGDALKSTCRRWLGWFVLIVGLWAVLLMLFETADSAAGGFEFRCGQLITADCFDPTGLRVWRAIMRFLARETHIMTSFANYVCDQNIRRTKLDSQEKFGSKSSCFQCHSQLLRDSLAVNYVAARLGAVFWWYLPLLVVAVDIVAFHFFFCLYVTTAVH